MESRELTEYFEILELPMEASLSDVRKAYLLLRDVYSTDSIVTLPVEDEFSAEEKKKILDQIETAYHRILESFKEEQKVSTPKEDVNKIIEDITYFNGTALKEIRQRLNIDINDVALATKIQAQHILNIENENFKDLPVYVYTRGFVRNYAAYLSLDEEKVAEDFMSVYKNWQNNRKN